MNNNVIFFLISFFGLELCASSSFLDEDEIALVKEYARKIDEYSEVIDGKDCAYEASDLTAKILSDIEKNLSFAAEQEESLDRAESSRSFFALLKRKSRKVSSEQQPRSLKENLIKLKELEERLSTLVPTFSHLCIYEFTTWCKTIFKIIEKYQIDLPNESDNRTLRKCSSSPELFFKKNLSPGYPKKINQWFTDLPNLDHNDSEKRLPGRDEKAKNKLLFQYRRPSTDKESYRKLSNIQTLLFSLRTKLIRMERDNAGFLVNSLNIPALLSYIEKEGFLLEEFLLESCKNENFSHNLKDLMQKIVKFRFETRSLLPCLINGTFIEQIFEISQVLENLEHSIKDCL